MELKCIYFKYARIMLTLYLYNYATEMFILVLCSTRFYFKSYVL